METIRLPVRGLQEDETISSMLDRAGSIYGVEGANVGQALLSRWRLKHPSAPETVSDRDHPPDAVLPMLAEACGIPDWERDKAMVERSPERWLRRGDPVARLLYASIVDSPRWLRPGQRTAWCPLCFARDISDFGVPYFRRHWARAATSFCCFGHPPQPLLNWPLGNTETSDPKHRGRPLPRALMTEQVVVSLGSAHDSKRAPRAGTPFALRRTDRERLHLRRKYETLPKVPYAHRILIYDLVRWEERLDTLLAMEDHAEKITWDAPPELDHTRALLAAIGAQAGQLLPPPTRANGKKYQSHDWHWLRKSSPVVPELLTSEDGIPETDQGKLWDEIRAWANPANRRALFWLAACAQGRPLGQLCSSAPVFLPLWFRWAGVKPLLSYAERKKEAKSAKKSSRKGHQL